MEYGCAVWSGGNTTGLQEIQNRFCKTHGIRLPDLQKHFDFLTLILFQNSKQNMSAVYAELATADVQGYNVV